MELAEGRTAPVTAPFVPGAGPAPHDLLRLRRVDDIIVAADLPSWATAALAGAPLVVVRRAPAPAGLVAIGLRGAVREKRLPALLPRAAILERIPPERLAAEAAWRRSPRRGLIAALAALEPVSALLDGLGAVWGPTGSVGFELASGVPAAGPHSDLDILIRRAAPWPLAEARAAVSGLDRLGVRTDAQIETQVGSVALGEFARGRTPVLLRTSSGPRLARDPWEA
jgi:phosphoribosyl-dephospho-CoA transferase